MFKFLLLFGALLLAVVQCNENNATKIEDKKEENQQSLDIIKNKIDTTINDAIKNVDEAFKAAGHVANENIKKLRTNLREIRNNIHQLFFSTRLQASINYIMMTSDQKNYTECLSLETYYEKTKQQATNESMNCMNNLINIAVNYTQEVEYNFDNFESILINIKNEAQNCVKNNNDNSTTFENVVTCLNTVNLKAKNNIEKGVPNFSNVTDDINAKIGQLLSESENCTQLTENRKFIEQSTHLAYDVKTCIKNHNNN